MKIIVFLLKIFRNYCIRNGLLDKIRELTVRTRRPGDFITVDENGGRKKLKDYFINEKIPKAAKG